MENQREIFRVLRRYYQTDRSHITVRKSPWDKQFEQDVAAGRLDGLADEAIRDLREGRCREL